MGAASSATPDGQTLKLKILQASGEVAAEMLVEDSSTVSSLLEKFVHVRGEGELPSSKLRLLYNTEVLRPSAILRDFSFPEDCTLQLVRLANHQFSRPFKSDIQDKSLKLIMVGDTGTGKSSFSQRYFNNCFSDHYRSTIGADYQEGTVLADGDLHIKVALWETGWQDRFRQNPCGYYRFFRGCDGFLITFAVTCRKSFEKLSFWLKELKSHTSGEAQASILVGLKSDLEEQREVSSDEAQEFAEANYLRYFESSSKSGDGVEETFCALLGACLDAR